MGWKKRGPGDKQTFSNVSIGPIIRRRIERDRRCGTRGEMHFELDNSLDDDVIPHRWNPISGTTEPNYEKHLGSASLSPNW
jgi:hypothetical protein